MKETRERGNQAWAKANRLLAALVLVGLLSCPGTAAIKRFTDDKGTLHISNEGGEGKPPLTITTPPGRPPKIRGPRAFPKPGPAPPSPARVSPPEPEDVPDDPPQAEEEEPPDEPPPGMGGAGPR